MSFWKVLFIAKYCSSYKNIELKHIISPFVNSVAYIMVVWTCEACCQTDVFSVVFLMTVIQDVLCLSAIFQLCCPVNPGKSCDSIVNHCECNPCFNGGSCRNRVDGYYCHCPFGK